MKRNEKSRLDVLMLKRRLVDSRERAKALIMSSNIYVDGKKALKPGMPVRDDVSIEVTAPLPFVSRGGLKLEKALDTFQISTIDKICLDCGASTGGFTDCLLQRGAKLVYAIDVGYGQLAWNLRNDPRVVVMERMNIRNITPDMLEIKPELAVIDLSFISISQVLPVLKKVLTSSGQVLCLIKPQFEAGREKVEKKGVVRSPETHKEVLLAFCEYSNKAGFSVTEMTHSPLKGPQGNIEFLALLRQVDNNEMIDTNEVVRVAHEELGTKI